MSIETTFTFSERKTYFNKFSVAVANNQPIGSYMQRTSLNDHGVYSIENNHPTLNNVQKSNLVHTITKGSLKQTYSWDLNENISIEDVENFKSFLISQYQSGTSTFEIQPNSFTVTYDHNTTISPWNDWQLSYGLKSSFSKLESTSDDFSFFCLTHVNNDVEDWTREHGDIELGETITLEKPENSECYILFSEEVTKSDSSLEAYKIYQLNSENITVINNTNNICKTIRIYK